MSDQEEYITAKQAREIMQVSAWKMAELLKSGDIPFKESPWDKRIKLIKREDVNAWMESAGPRVKREESEEGRAALAIA